MQPSAIDVKVWRKARPRKCQSIVGRETEHKISGHLKALGNTFDGIATARPTPHNQVDSPKKSPQRALFCVRKE